MATDSMEEKAAYPCETATEKELSYAAFLTTIGNRDECQKLQQITVRISAEEVHWTFVRNLWILGNAYQGCNEALEAAGLKPGMYINRGGDWLLLIHPEETVIQTALNLGGKSLKALELYHTSLQNLDVSSCTGLNSFCIKNDTALLEIHGLSELKQLTTLRFRRCSNLTQLPPMDNLEQLTELDLSGCSSLTRLPSLDSLTKLTELYLSGCTIIELPDGIRSMKALRRLDLSELKLRKLPDWLPEIAESFSLGYGVEEGKNKAAVYLHGTTVDDIPDMSIFDLPFEVVAEWFNGRRRGRTEPLNEIKVVFLGDGEAGKSHTIARLMNDGGEPDHASFNGWFTPGIVIRDKEYDLGNRKIRVHYWDIGGQEIMHSMHRIFLTGRAMYVILLNARDDTQNERARYWIHNIKSFAPTAPVLLVLNKIDQNENASVDELDLRGRYENLTQVVRLSALTYTTEQFNNSLTKVLLEEIQKTGYLDAQWPVSWIKVKEKLENMYTHYITGSDYQAICREYEVDDNQEHLLHWFNDLGISFCCADGDDYVLEDYVIFRPDWITNALYTILFNSLEGSHNGLIPHRSIYNLLKDSYSNPEIRCTLPQVRYTSGDIYYVLGIMRKFNLSFTDGYGNEFIPMLCQRNSTVDIHRYAKDSDILEFRMVFDYLPNNLLHQLMVERHTELDMNNVWRTGARFHLKEVGLSAIVVIDGNVLKFFIRHTDPTHRPNTYLTMLKEHVEQIGKKLGLPVLVQQIVYKQDGKQQDFDYEELEQASEDGQTHIYSRVFRKRIAIEDILNQAGPDTYKSKQTKQLVTDITKACVSLQQKPIPRREDERTLILKDYLSERGYLISDPALLRATTLSGKRGGEPDLFLSDKRQNPLTIIEAMNSRGNSIPLQFWDNHLTKLLHHYNTRNLSPLFLICYVECEEKAYANLWHRCREHIRRYAPDRSELVYDSYTELERDYNYLRIAYCRYIVNGKEITVYHYFVRVESAESEVFSPQPHKPVEEQEKPQGQQSTVEPMPPQPVESPKPTMELQNAEQTALPEPETPQQAVPVLQDYRVVFLGDSEAGKSLILSRLNNPEMDPKDFHGDTTIGINIIPKVEDIKGRRIRVNYWDFGGQEILHSMHRIFLAKNTLYVIVLNTRNDNQDAQAIFWLRYVETYAQGAPVLLVMNKIDQNKRASLNFPVLRKLFPNRIIERDDVPRISAMWRGVEHRRFQNEFTEELHNCINRHVGIYNPYSAEEAQVLNRIETMKNAGNKEDRIKIIPTYDFRQICEEVGVPDCDALMDRFNETGVLVYYKGKTPMYMNPAWITNTLYRMLEQGNTIADNGVVLHKKIQDLCYANPDNWRKSEDAAYLIDIMRDFDLSFEYEKQIQGAENTADKEFIPMLCQREEPRDIEELINAENTVELRMVFEYLPCGVLYKLLVDHQKLLDRNHVWLTGMKLDRKNGSSYAVVRQDGNVMSIFVHDDSISDAMEWMLELRGKIEYEAKYGKYTARVLETRLAYNISDIKEYFDYQLLKNAEKKGVYYTVSHSETAPQKVAIRDILSQKDGTVLDRIDELLKYTSKGCQNLQGMHTYWFLAPDIKDDRRGPKMDEDGRTQMLETVLGEHFLVQPQKRWGDSSSGIKQGELDLWIGIDHDTPLALLEALNITSYGKETPNAVRDNYFSVVRWNEHLSRVMGDYNKNGFKNILLVSYLDCPAERLKITREEYFNRLKNFDVPRYGAPKYCEPVVVDEFIDGIHVVRADYSSSAGDVTVYHFLVRIEQYGRKALEKAQATQL